MATATLNGNSKIETLAATAEETSESRVRSSGNPLMKRLAPEMLSAPYPLDFVDGMMSDNFTLEKCHKTIIEPLAIKTQKDWLDYRNFGFKTPSF